MTTQRHEVSTVKSVRFGMLSKEQIERMSVVEVTEGTFYDSNGDPKLNSLFDPRMGVIERGRKCKTCEQDYILCPGHPGHISLARPIFNIQFDKEIIKIAKCYCCRCSKLLVNKDHPSIKAIIKSTRGKRRFKKIFKLVSAMNKVNRCGTVNENEAGTILDNGGCGALQPDKYLNTMNQNLLTAQWRAERMSGATMPEGMVVDAMGMVEQKLGAEYVLAWFKRISDEDAAVMSFSPDWCMPKDLIVETVLVVPPACRPSVRQYNGQRSEDDITHSYISIIKFNNILKEALTSSQPMTEDQLMMSTRVVQYHVMTLHDNDGKKLAQAQTRTYRPIKSFVDRLKGKEGRIRSNLMGKRVDFSARSVISPDANIKMSELGVPLEIAMNLTYPEIVNKYNINEMYKLARNGNKVYPGAKSIEAGKTKRTTMLMDSNLDDIILEYGDTVHRHLQDGDYVLFNRQPTLHRMSMMAHKVKVMPGKTFRFNTDICEPYNAD